MVVVLVVLPSLFFFVQVSLVTPFPITVADLLVQVYVSFVVVLLEDEDAELFLDEDELEYWLLFEFEVLSVGDIPVGQVYCG